MKKLLTLSLITLIISCAPIRVNHDYDKAVNFSKYKTYKYFSDIKTGLTPLDEKRFLDALDLKMTQNGFKVSNNPDFLIDIKSTQIQTAPRQTVGVGLGGNGGAIGGGISIGLPVGQPNLSRQITIDFVDKKGVGLFWQAQSTSSYKPNTTPLKRETRLQAIANKMLKAYPPKVK